VCTVQLCNLCLIRFGRRLGRQHLQSDAQGCLCGLHHKHVYNADGDPGLEPDLNAEALEGAELQADQDVETLEGGEDDAQPEGAVRKLLGGQTADGGAYSEEVEDGTPDAPAAAIAPESTAQGQLDGDEDEVAMLRETVALVSALCID
jgi:hypothetical protein